MAKSVNMHNICHLISDLLHMCVSYACVDVMSKVGTVEAF